MVADSDGQTLTAVVICEGNISDPDFPDRLNDLVGKLSSLITPEDEEGYDTDSSTSSSSSSSYDEKHKRENSKVKVAKVEPWNSVRVTLSIPKEAATKLRELASAGNNALKALGILSVQLEGDSVISLRLVGREIVLRTDGASKPSASSSSTSSSGVAELSKILQQQQQQQSSSSSPILDPVPGTSKVTPQQNGPTSSSIFKSPNTVCPMDGKLPTHVPSLGSENVAEYPFESMIQARVIHRRENTMGMSPPVTTTPFVQPAPPPPYPSNASSAAFTKGSPSQNAANSNNGSNNIAISSPLLVNLLQNEGASGPSNGSTGAISKQQQQDRVNTSIINSGNGGNKCTVQANNNSSNKGLMSKSTTTTSQQVAGTQQQHDKQAIVINNNLLSNKSPNSGSSELSNNSGAAAASTSTTSTPSMSPLGAQSSPVPLPTNANSSNVNNNAGQLRRQMSTPGNVRYYQQDYNNEKKMKFPQTHSQTQQQQQQQFKYVVPNAIRQQFPLQAAQQVTPNAAVSYPNASGGSVNVRWKQMEQIDPGCQEFDRYQKQYNHSQQQQENTQVGPDLPPSYGQQEQQQQQHPQPTNRQQHPDPLGLGNLADLADLSKNDLDSLLPSYHPHDLDSALLAFDTKGTSLDSLLDIDLLSSLDSGAGASASGNSSVVTVNHSQQQQQPLTNGPIIDSNHTSSSPQVQLKQTGSKVTMTTPNDAAPQRFLINPLTGDMEIAQVEDTSEQDATNVALVGADFHETYEKGDEGIEDDDDESSRGTNFSAKFLTSDMSDTEKSNQSGEHMLMQLSVKGTTSTKKGGRTKKEKVLNADGTVVKVVKDKTQKTRVSKVKKAVITPVPSPTGGANAELKLRLKLDTGGGSTTQTTLNKKPIASKPTAMVAQQYNFNASIAQQFMQQSQIVSNAFATTNNLVNSIGEQQQQSPEEPRVPPLHISIKNKSVVIKSSTTSSGHKKEKKRFLSQSGSESGDDSSLRLKKKNSELLKIMSETDPDPKRSAHEISSPNGMLCPEKKQRLNSDDTTSGTPIVGSTNIGTIGSYSLSNHLKEKSNLRTLLKTSSTPPSVSTTTSTATPAKSPVKNSLVVNSMNNSTGSSSNKTTLKALLTQGSDNMINEEKFKQKLLENNEGVDVGGDMTFQNVSSKTSVVQQQQQASSDNQSNSGVAPNIQRPSLAQQQQRQPENSPKRETMTGGGILIDPALLQQNVRGSPGSQAQGEDSGIESMDALSEKSPHQNSHSPQGGATENLLMSRTGDVNNTTAVTTTSSGRDTNNSTNNNKVSVSDLHSCASADDFYGPNDIEAALANMEGLDEIVASYEKETRINGDHSAIVTSKSNLLADLGEPKEDKYEFHDSPQSHTLLRPSKDHNENKEVVTKDECCNTTTPQNIVKSVSVKKEEKSDLKDDLLEPCPVRTTPALYTYSNRIDRGDIGDTPDIKVEIPSPSDKMLTQLSIEIPQNNENDNSTRIRTRASSKLESPLEIGTKQSPSDSPAANLKATLSKLSAAAIDRLSPKGSQGNKKRKRAGSESSNQSCVSDDLQTRTKKSKKTELTESNVNKAQILKTSTTNVTNVKQQQGNPKPTDGNPIVKMGSRSIKRSECSSDSDEPLIEVQGKVRNSKLNRSASSSTSSLTGDCEKVLRNHRIVNANNTPQTQQQQPSVAKIVPKTVTTSATTNANTNATEEKISTRRSVRMTSSALSTSALNKAKVQAGSPAVQGVAANTKTGNGTVNTPQKEGQEGTPEARRKTRSAGLDGTPITAEGRRRRNSPDRK